MTDHIELNQMSVSRDPNKNKRRCDKDRIENLESDIILMTDAIGRLVEQNDKYTEYLEGRILSEKERHDFWLDVRKKLVASGIWGTIVVISTAVFYAAKQWVENH